MSYAISRFMCVGQAASFDRVQVSSDPTSGLATIRGTEALDDLESEELIS
jgi:hypothetical protein